LTNDNHSGGRLRTENRFADPDLAYRMIVEAHRGLSDKESQGLNAKLALLLANHIGDDAILAEAIAIAKR
jgi:hypothetical protein